MVGQAAITSSSGQVDDLSIDPSETAASRDALEAVAEADQIVLGPGSLYTSVLSALKVQMLAESVSDAEAQKVVVMNLITQDGETLGMTGADHLEALHKHTGIEGPGVVIVHDGPLDVPKGHDRLNLDSEQAASLGWRAVFADVAHAGADWPEHDPLKLGRVLEELVDSEA